MDKRKEENKHFHLRGSPGVARPDERSSPAFTAATPNQQATFRSAAGTNASQTSASFLCEQHMDWDCA